MATGRQARTGKRNVKKAAATARRNLPGRSRIGRDELARALGRA